MSFVALTDGVLPYDETRFAQKVICYTARSEHDLEVQPPAKAREPLLEVTAMLRQSRDHLGGDIAEYQEIVEEALEDYLRRIGGTAKADWCAEPSRTEPPRRPVTRRQLDGYLREWWGVVRQLCKSPDSDELWEAACRLTRFIRCAAVALSATEAGDGRTEVLQAALATLREGFSELGIDPNQYWSGELRDAQSGGRYVENMCVRYHSLALLHEIALHGATEDRLLSLLLLHFANRQQTRIEAMSKYVSRMGADLQRFIAGCERLQAGVGSAAGC